MQNTALLAIPLCVLTVAAIAGAADDFKPETIISLERAALDRWAKGDVQGPLEICAPEVTYYDPSLERIIDGKPALAALYAPIAGKFKIDQWDMLDAKVQRHGSVAVLTYRTNTHSRTSEGRVESTRWNVTEVYALLDGKWKIVHGHFSYTKPELKKAGAE